jgi:hypothetical protein
MSTGMRGRRCTVRSAVVMAAAVLTAAAALAGCSGSSGPAPTQSSASPAPKAAPATSIPASPPNDPAARQNAQITACKATKDGWEADGSATNPGTAPVSYTITVFFTTTAATVVSTAETKVTINPGATEKWAASSTFAADPQMLCVLRGVG